MFTSSRTGIAGSSVMHGTLDAERGPPRGPLVEGFHRAGSALELDAIAASKLRCRDQYGLDPTSLRAPTALSRGELEEARAALEPLLGLAHVALSELHGQIRRSGYSLILANHEGICVEHRCEETEPDRTRVGSLWSEECEGTNGIGTCLIERRSVVVHRHDHYYARHWDDSEAATPLFNPSGELLAVLEIHTVDPKPMEGASVLTIPIIEATAHIIEELLFRSCFARAWVLSMVAPAHDGSALLLAVDREGRILDADHRTRIEFGLNSQALADGISLSTLFQHDRAPFRRKDGADSTVKLTNIVTGEVCSAIVSAPHSRLRANLSGLETALCVQSRRALVWDVHRRMSSTPAQGELACGSLHRVRQYVDEHLQENITLAQLAREARLSAHHFARSFKCTVGVSPRRFVVQRRVERASELLCTTSASLAQVARSVGFVDQSHLARHFCRLHGVSPSDFRRAYNEDETRRRAQTRAVPAQ